MSRKVEQEMPDWLQNLPAISDDEKWKDIERRLSELCDVLNQVKFETKRHAVPQRQGNETKALGYRWFDPDARAKVRPWLEVPYDPDRDIETFLLKRDIALGLSQRLRPKIQERATDITFIAEWGVFNEYAGIIEHEYLRERPNLQYLSGANSQSRDQHRRWYSHVSALLREPGDKRRMTDDRFIEFVQNILANGYFPRGGFDENWYEQLLSKDQEHPASSLMQNKLSRKKMDELARSSLDDLPPIDSESYHL